jgi:hypothetical protein
MLVWGFGFLNRGSTQTNQAQVAFWLVNH